MLMRSPILVCLFAAVLAAPLSAAAQLRVALSTDKTNYVPGEPVIAHVQIINEGAEPVQVPMMLTPEYGALKYLITPEDGGEVEFVPWTLIENVRTQTLGAKQAVNVAARIFFGAGGWTFVRAGSYQVRARLLGVVSEPARVVVQPPATDAERRQSDRVVAHPEAGFVLLFEGGDHLSAGIELLREIAPSNTRLSGYANYTLGVMHSKPFADYTKGTIRQPNWTEAERFLRRGMDLIPNEALSFRINNQSLLTRALVTNGKAAEATKLRQQFSVYLKDDLLKRDLPAALKGFVQNVKPQ
jgi:hypothetical protein